ncbi:ArnT family glycosyltransferase [Tautonia rosea]|uniref:ArnT family glycosyltransferase n=1 Tax=Tautonia rosea TaxID=2728037 RepID=UPI0014744686|nr:glycosyltransferase family 39 protein [Tautonia rosea]
MLDLGFVVLLMLWSAIVGLALLRRFGPVPESRSEAIGLAVPLGLGLLAMAALGLGQVGWLGRPGLIGVLLVGLLLGLRPRVWESLRSGLGCPRLVRTEAGRIDPVGVVFDLAMGLILLGSLLTALIPPTDGDALCYHLQVPKLFLWSGSVFYEPDLHETVYPLVTEMLYAVGLVFRGPVACRLIQWAFGVFFAWNVASLARPFLGDRARWAATIALGVPAVSNGMGAPLNDVALATMATAALVAWTRWLDRPSGAGAALIGVLIGLAMGVKYPALVWGGVIGLGMLLSTRPGRLPWRTVLRHAAVCGGVALLIGGSWYLRAYLHTGNPVHPFFRETFGSGFDVVLSDDKRPMEPTAWNLVTAIVPMTLDPNRFDSFAHQFGPAFLLFLPAILIWRPPIRLMTLVLVAYAFLLICLSQRQSMRFVLPGVGPMAVAVAWLVADWSRRRGIAPKLLMASVVVMLAFEATIALSRPRHGLAVALGIESAEEFLARREPTYRVGQWIDDRLPESARIVGQDHRGFYLPRPYAMEKAHRRRTGLGTRGETPEQILAHFSEEGFTHVLVCPPEPLDAIEFDPDLNTLLGSWINDQVPLYAESITDPDGVTRHYALYRLPDPTNLARTQAAGEERR